MTKATTLATLAAATFAVAGGLAVWSGRSHAADHLDPPARTDPMNGGMDRNADIADVYAWHQGTGADQRVVLVLSFSGPNAPAANQRMACDRDVLYGIHIDNSVMLDGNAEVNIYARMAQDDLMNCYVQWTGIPGTTVPTVTGENVTRTVGNVKLYAGLRDDAFFFDLQGFRDTLMAAGNPMTPAGVGGDRGIRMTNDRDFFAGKNTSALVIELPVSSARGMGTTFRVWGTTARARM
jgi:hypothetical protein